MGVAPLPTHVSLLSALVHFEASFWAANLISDKRRVQRNRSFPKYLRIINERDFLPKSSSSELLRHQSLFQLLGGQIYLNYSNLRLYLNYSNNRLYLKKEEAI